MNKKAKLPALKDRQSFSPTKALCPWCRKHKVLEPHSMVLLSGGALAKAGRDHYSGPTKGLKAFLDFRWHGAHDGGEGKYRENSVDVSVAQDVHGGIFTIAFCSVQCLREFLNSCLDQLEAKIKKMKPLA
jgi:hypothetical protein